MRQVVIAVLACIAIAPLGGAEIEQEARRLEAMLIAPCCFSQQVSVHTSPAADEVRKDVRARLAAGETTDQILQAYVARYGKRVLAQPPDEGFDRILNLLPPLGLVLTAGLTMMVVRRFQGRRSTVTQVGADRSSTAADRSSTAAEERFGRALDDQLRDLD